MSYDAVSHMILRFFDEPIDTAKVLIGCLEVLIGYDLTYPLAQLRC